MDIELTKKQSKTWKYLTDKVTNEVLYGGGVSGGKSFIGCLWIATMALQYEETRYIIGRSVLQTLKQTTLATLFEVLSKMGLKPSQHYTFNGQSNTVTFFNKSEIILKNLEYTPSDPNYESLQGYEVTAVFVDEATQITQMCYNILKSRIRYSLTKYGLIPKILMSCNPSNGWVKSEFYIPFREGTLPETKRFVPSLVTDNPHVSEEYLKVLDTLPLQQRKRLVEGDWDYLDDADMLFDYDSILRSVFRFAPNPADKKYLSVDVSRMGEDRSVAVVWVGNVIIEINIYRKLMTTQLSTHIMELMKVHGIHPSNVIVDTDGIGAGVGDQIRGTNFVNNSQALYGQNFSNLKSQCYFKLSDMFKEGLISINVMNPDVIQDLTQELLSVKIKNLDKDQKVSVMSKDEQKRLLGRSPDISDALMMKMYYDVKNNNTTKKYGIAFI